MNRKLIWIPIIISFIVFATLCKTDFSVDAMDNTQNSVKKKISVHAQGDKILC